MAYLAMEPLLMCAFHFVLCFIYLTLIHYLLHPVSHLGCEVTLRPSPAPCQVSGTHITPGTHVVVHSAFPDDSDPTDTRLSETIQWLQGLPLIGRVLAHGPGFYWVALKGVQQGACEWVYN